MSSLWLSDGLLNVFIFSPTKVVGSSGLLFFLEISILAVDWADDQISTYVFTQL